MLRKIKKLGLDVSTHYEPISEGDLLKIQLAFKRRSGFDLTLGFGRRGVENQRELTRNSFRVEVDDVGCEFITSTHSELTKNNRGDLRDSNEPKPRIYATGTPSCPVASFKQYVSKLHPENTALFQRPRKLTNTSPDTHWYTAQALGHNSLSKMMKSISEEAKLSKIYTNHCVRATTVTLLSHAGVECRDIMKLTGHRNEQSLMSYNCDSSSAQKRRWKQHHTSRDS
ncbi:uncharacterized protein [Haliotis cracherodii]|uniref:uncharacterized protein n=1 Tax=Haliotis cracherodii TaxID=6455 RepID=UPI0039ED7A62